MKAQSTYDDIVSAPAFAQRHPSVPLSLWIPDGTGSDEKHFLSYSGPGPILVLAPTHSGKAPDISVPACATWQGPLLVCDRELDRILAAGRSAIGPTYVFSPFEREAPYAKGVTIARINPFDLVRWGTKHEDRDLATLTRSLCKLEDTAGERAAARVIAVMAKQRFACGRMPTLLEMHDMFDKLDALKLAALLRSVGAEAGELNHARVALSRTLAIYRSSIVAEMTGATDFDIDRFTEDHSSLFVTQNARNADPNENALRRAVLDMMLLRVSEDALVFNTKLLAFLSTDASLTNMVFTEGRTETPGVVFFFVYEGSYPLRYSQSPEFIQKAKLLIAYPTHSDHDIAFVSAQREGAGRMLSAIKPTSAIVLAEGLSPLVANRVPYFGRAEIMQRVKIA